MSQSSTLKAEPRTRVGKGSARALRREGKIPAVIYGDKQAPLSITVSANEIYHRIYRGHFTTTIVDIEVDGKTIRALPREYQMDPVKDMPLHGRLYWAINNEGRCTWTSCASARAPW